ncbi:unnamed protein product [Meloidogyne enterolobii]|uniref:Uncharacterized protein n=1 Tax=Meloidogyne enterolobii TaxID=390850 RepID=A0ACB0Z4U3_MELEN
MSSSIKICLLFIFATLVINSQQQCVPIGGSCVNKFCCGDLLCFKWGNGHQCHTCKKREQSVIRQLYRMIFVVMFVILIKFVLKDEKECVEDLKKRGFPIKGFLIKIIGTFFQKKNKSIW